MTRLWSQGEPIQVETDGAEHPSFFVWQQRRHRVQQIHQHWLVDTDWWTEAGRAHRAYFALTTTDGLLCVIYHDRLTGAWRLSKVYD